MRGLATLSWRRSAGIVAVALIVAGAHPRAQFEKMISTTFDGWNKLADGSYEHWVGGGERTVDEMSIAHIDFIYLSDEDYKAAIAKKPQATNNQQQ